MGDVICKINSATVSFLRVFLLMRSYAVSPLRWSTLCYLNNTVILNILDTGLLK